jgi:hypothetical protein
MNIKETFLKLTEYTIPFKHEHELEHLLPNGWKRDSVGNYYYEIGKSETLFTSHLDTYCKEKVKVNHVIEDEWIKTDGTTILGGDNKAGCCVLFYLIEQQVPGTYYFFLSEEPISNKGGLWGSRMILKKNPEFFKKFKRAVAFDRKQIGSIITRQSARFCCSNEFAEDLINQYKKVGLPYQTDMTGWYTDTATFMDVIPECTNISAGVWGEHTTKEMVNIKYLEAVCKASANIDWENTPVVRTPGLNRPKKDKRNTTLSRYIKFKSKDTYEDIDDFLSNYGFNCLNADDFHAGHPMMYSAWHQDIEFSISILGDDILFDGKKFPIGTFKSMIDPNWNKEPETDGQDEK